ncbi:MAG: hypothetical protein K2Y37_07775 [Pirellulales bacterium]|nr:hypothetical protein [Pirellulales bacterium]
MFLAKPSRIIVFAFVMLMTSASRSGEPPEGQAAMPIVPDPIVQARLTELGKAVHDANDSERSKERFLRAIVALHPVARKDRTELVRQLLWFHTHATDIADGAVLPMVIAYVLQKGDLVHAIAPLLDTPDKPLRRSVLEVADLIENASPGRGPDFGHYRDVIGASHHFSQEIEPGLAGHMFERSPGDALRAFVIGTIEDGEQRKPFLWAGHVVDDMLWKVQNGFIKQQSGSVKPEDIPADVPPQLELMAARPEWWARLYVAAIMAQHKELATPELITKLRRDDNELVRKFIEQVQPTPPTP